MSIEPVIFLPKAINHDSILTESSTGNMYYINRGSFIVPHSHDESRQAEFEEKLTELLLKFNEFDKIEISGK